MSNDQQLSVLVCSEADPNYVDGAVTQLVSLTEVLDLAGFRVTVLLRASIKQREGRATDRLFSLPNVTVLEPSTQEIDQHQGRMSPARMAQKIARVVESGAIRLVISRGLELNLALLEHSVLDGKRCPYLTDIPENSREIERYQRRQISAIAAKATIFFTQTEESRAFLESEFAELAGKTSLLWPMVPDSAFLSTRVDEAQAPTESGPLRLVYAGKFKQEWKTLEMTALPARAAAEGVDLTVQFMGDKFMNSSTDASWSERMKTALEASDGVEWLGAVSREESLRQSAHADIGLSWRDMSVDTSSQLSTKVLEYAAAGTPPLLRRTSTHESLFGAEYPLFLDEDDALPTLLRIARDRSLLRQAQEIAQSAVRKFSYEARAKALGNVILRSFAEVRVFGNSPLAVSRSKQRTKILVAGYDFKFMGELIDLWQRDPSIELSFDKWRDPLVHQGSISKAEARKADLIFCEWCTTSAVWYSQIKAPHQKLVIRLHRFEINGVWPHQLNYDNVDAFVTVGNHIARRMRDETNVPHDRLHWIPNTVNALDLGRPKTKGAEFRLGIAGVMPIRKRPDRALAVFRELKKLDSRFSLNIRGRLPSSYTDFSKDGFYRQYYRELFHEFTSQGELYGSVFHQRFGPDIANWFRRIGWVLSPSTDESFHMIVPEGMASGAVPAIWNWDGAAEIYSDRWVHSDQPAAIASHIYETVASGEWESERAAALEYAQQFDQEVVGERWRRLFESL